jgi:hypothetical protein
MRLPANVGGEVTWWPGAVAVVALVVFLIVRAVRQRVRERAGPRGEGGVPAHG